MINIRKYVELFDYKTISEWWEKRGWPIIPSSALPSNGVVATRENGTPIFACFLYLTDSNIAWCEWAIASPETSPEERSDAIIKSIGYLCELAKSLGFKSVFSSVNNKRLLEKFKTTGFRETDSGMTNLIRSL